MDKLERLLEKQNSQIHTSNKELREIRLTLEEIQSTLHELLAKKAPKENKRPIHKPE